MDSCRKYLAFLVSFATSDAEFAGKLLTAKRNLGIIELGLYRNTPESILNRAAAPFMKLNAKSQIMLIASVPVLFVLI